MTITPELLLSHLPPFPILVEAGAYDGADTLRLAKHARRVHAFEPVPALYAALVTTVSSCPNVRVYPLALGGDERAQNMWISGGDGTASSSLLPPRLHCVAFPGISFADRETVSVTTLAKWAGREGVEHIDGMWLDMQGAELEALKAAGPLLDDVRAIVLEISTDELYEQMPLWPEVEEWLNRRGFQTVEVEMETSQFGNALLIR